MNKETTRARAGGPLIIGTGLPRTGTTSLYEALETLGFTPCHHFRSMIAGDWFPYRHSRLWSKAAKTQDKDTRQEILHHLLTERGCKAAVDYPTSCFVDDLVEMYPNAKFIHGERSSPEVWRKSFNETIGRLQQDKVAYYAAYLIPLFRFALVPIYSAMDERNVRIFSASIFNPDSQIELYHRHNAFMRQVVPKDKLLEYDPKQGYEQLCKFLNVPVPTDERGNKLDFPHANDSERFKRGWTFAIVLGCTTWLGVVGGAYYMARSIARATS
ncbi:P-loop containing nucleoside triphosphate hydrolase protein [Neohortaea acidophila]|uniref:P-loop containing nucleoside triphosphate hydrolase protein n=1 Tax=Neohortaea acidophila TaxID=245834 RepID=A0A6A6PJX0_9PEZI|nr:P-loop containing nucleoside triphosphate hydrolase protein [Neohortaea acidophila]KAF2479813.1 P-loop containing nucleoside triphosphate hydrolase protein [Neohortaea acidophila]